MDDELREELRMMRGQLDRVEGKIDALFAVRAQAREKEGRRVRASMAKLTAKQHAVVQMLAMGLTEPEQAKRLGVSRNTVKLHKQAAVKNLEVEGLQDLLRWHREVCVELSEREYEEAAGLPKAWAARWREGEELPEGLKRTR